jgi:hypothetical protein
MQSFLGLVDYYRKFIKEFSGIVVPLTNALQNASQMCPIIWDSTMLKAVGAVLTQNDHPVAFESKKLNLYQLNYAVHDKEMCAIMHALE